MPTPRERPTNVTDAQRYLALSVLAMLVGVGLVTAGVVALAGWAWGALVAGGALAVWGVGLGRKGASS